MDPYTSWYSAKTDWEARLDSSNCSSNINQASSEMCVKENKYFHKGSNVRVFTEEGRVWCECLMHSGFLPYVLYQRKWKMFPKTCKILHCKLNRIYKFFGNKLYFLQLLFTALIQHQFISHNRLSRIIFKNHPLIHG